MTAPPAGSSPTAKATLHSPWASVVRGSDHELAPPPPPPSSSSPSPAPEQTPPKTPEPSADDDPRDADDNVEPGRVSRPAWKALINGVVEASGIKHVDALRGAGGSGVMGDDVAWPALSESTRASTKSSSSDSLALPSLSKTLSEGSSSGSQVPVLPYSQHKGATSSNGSPRAIQNKTVSQFRKPNRSNDAGAVRNSDTETNSSAASNSGGRRQPPSSFNISHLTSPMPPPFPTFRVPSNGYVNIVPPMVDFLNREPPYRDGGWDSRPSNLFSHPPMVDDPVNSSRRGNFGPRDGDPQNNNNRNMRDRGRGNPLDRRDARPQQQRRGAPRGYRGPPPLNAPLFVAAQPMIPPFGPPIGFSDISSPFFYPSFTVDPYRNPSYMEPHPTEIMMPMPETPLPALLVKQINYYFSDANLIQDNYLKSNMDDEGWVPIGLIAGFRRVKTLTEDIQLILKSLRDSSIVEVKDDKVRRRGEWMKWLRFSAHGSVQSGSPSTKVANSDEPSLVTSLQNVTLVGASPQDDSSAKVSPVEDSLPHRQ